MAQHIPKSRSSAPSVALRKFGPNGASRDIDDGKLDYEGFLNPLVLAAFARYMHTCRKIPGGLRNSDNWQLGIPLPVYMKSKWRHDMDMWAAHRGLTTKDHQIINATAVMFNTMGYLLELLKATPREEVEAAFVLFERHRQAEIDARLAAAASPSPSRTAKPAARSKPRSARSR